MLQTYEGYLEKGQFYPTGETLSLQGRFRVIVTFFDEVSPEQTIEADTEIEKILDEADRAAAASDIRYTHEEVFSRIRAGINERRV